MSIESIFPPDTKDAEATYKHLLGRGQQERAPRAALWRRTYQYLQGMRNFVMNFRDGSVKGSYVDERGRLKFVFEQVLSNYTTQMGRLLGMDFTPRCVPNVQSLDGLRNAAIAQAVLRDIFSPKQLGRLKRALLPGVLNYGVVGAQLWANEQNPKEMGIEVLQPWSITPIPIDLTCPSECRGLIIRRIMPIEQIRRKFSGQGTKRGALADADTTTVARGDLPGSFTEDSNLSMDSFFEGLRAFTSDSDRQDGSDKGKSARMDVAWLSMVYLWDEQNYLTEQLVFVSGKLLRRETFTGFKIYRPVTTIHDIDAGGFWSRAWMELQIPMNQETEAAIAAVFKNQQDMDLYGTVFAPASWGITRHALYASQGRKVQFYEPDGMAPPNQSIFNFQPHNTGTFPIQVANMGVSLGDRLANQPLAMTRGDAPGRVDSQPGMGFLMETANIPLSPTAEGISAGLSDLYCAALCRAQQVWESQEVRAVSMLGTSALGLVYNPKTGILSFGTNGIPHPDKVNVTIASMLPVSRAQQKAELDDQLFRLKTITPSQYRIKSRLLNLDTPVCNEIEWNNYEKACWENQLLFHDGQNVPEGSEDQVGVLFSRDADLHPIHIQVHQEAISTTAFSLAAQPVRQRLLAHLQMHLDASGVLPNGMPTPDEAGQEELLRQQQMAQMAQSGMGGGMM
jgi:hypothetical protein